MSHFYKKYIKYKYKYHQLKKMIGGNYNDNFEEFKTNFLPNYFNINYFSHPENGKYIQYDIKDFINKDKYCYNKEDILLKYIFLINRRNVFSKCALNFVNRNKDSINSFFDSSNNFILIDGMNTIRYLKQLFGPPFLNPKTQQLIDNKSIIISNINNFFKSIRSDYQNTINYFTELFSKLFDMGKQNNLDQTITNYNINVNDIEIEIIKTFAKLLNLKINNIPNSDNKYKIVIISHKLVNIEDIELLENVIILYTPCETVYNKNNACNIINENTINETNQQINNNEIYNVKNIFLKNEVDDFILLFLYYYFTTNSSKKIVIVSNDQFKFFNNNYHSIIILNFFQINDIYNQIFMDIENYLKIPKLNTPEIVYSPYNLFVKLGDYILSTISRKILKNNIINSFQDSINNIKSHIEIFFNNSRLKTAAEKRSFINNINEPIFLNSENRKKIHILINKFQTITNNDKDNILRYIIINIYNYYINNVDLLFNFDKINIGYIINPSLTSPPPDTPPTGAPSTSPPPDTPSTSPPPDTPSTSPPTGAPPTVTPPIFPSTSTSPTVTPPTGVPSKQLDRTSILPHPGTPPTGVPSKQLDRTSILPHPGTPPTYQQSTYDQSTYDQSTYQHPHYPEYPPSYYYGYYGFYPPSQQDVQSFTQGGTTYYSNKYKKL